MTAPTQKPRAYRIKDWPDFLQVVDHLRYRRELSVRDLADRTGSGYPHLGKQLLGRVLPLAPFVWVIAKALGYDVALIPREDDRG
jgi:transcriptional regulator with XRE-family HTH domain